MSIEQINTNINDFIDIDCSNCFSLIGKVSKEHLDNLEIDSDELGLICPKCYNNVVIQSK